MKNDDNIFFLTEEKISLQKSSGVWVKLIIRILSIQLKWSGGGRNQVSLSETSMYPLDDVLLEQQECHADQSFFFKQEQGKYSHAP